MLFLDGCLNLPDLQENNFLTFFYHYVYMYNTFVDAICLQFTRL